MRGGFSLDATVFKTAMVNADVGVRIGQVAVDDVGGKLPNFFISCGPVFLSSRMRVFLLNPPRERPNA